MSQVKIGSVAPKSTFYQSKIGGEAKLPAYMHNMKVKSQAITLQDKISQ